MKVITWNVNNRVGAVSQQVKALGDRELDVVALQDINYNAVARYIEAFCLIGLPHVLHTLERQPQGVPTGVLLASRFPLSLLPDQPESVLWSQGYSTPDRERLRQHWCRRTLFALLHGPSGEIELANIYITPANHFEKDANEGRKLYPYLKLDLLAGYGYRPGRSVVAYLLVIGLFATTYALLGQAVHPSFSPLAALIFSITSFHGRCFFPGGIPLDNPITVLAALEAILGLMIEISFIATFTQRYFGK